MSVRFEASVIVFDMDGVLVNVRASYRDCIIATVEKLAGRTITHDGIQEYKNRGGFNNDWLLTQRICADFGVGIDYETVVGEFNALFFGPDGSGNSGFMGREIWLPAPGLLDRLAARSPLYIFTGRLREEALMTLRRFGATTHFAGVVGDDDVTHAKPHPDGLHRIQQRHAGASILYLGDTVDDRRAGEGAGVDFLGVGPHSGARHAIDDINRLESFLK